MFSKLGTMSFGKLYNKVKNIGYKLGLVEFKVEDVDLSKIPETKVPGYEFPHQPEESEIAYIKDILPKIEEAKKAARDIQKVV
jgi:hypothetical protein